MEPVPPDARVLLLDARARLSIAELEEWIADPRESATVFGSPRPDAAWTAAWLDGKQTSAILTGEEPQLPGPESSAGVGPALFEHPWQLVAANGKDLCEDFRALKAQRGISRSIFGVRFQSASTAPGLLADREFGDASRAMVYPGVHILAEQNLLFGSGARIKPGVVLDAEDGPIVLGAGCRIESNVTIQGPAYVGPGSTVHPMSRLREGSSVGALCKVGGEIEEAVLLDLSNKQHDGFLGHAYLGSWVNLGADTNASDLKNNYGTVRVDLGDGPVDTGERFVGPLLGDHVRTGINTMLTTGTVAGVCCNVFGGGFPPAFLASFSWGGAEARVEYRLEQAIETARVVHGRRGVEFTELHEQLLREIHEATATERERH
jgi:UDP-N-acetylglucosamine diphosphorylase/glucosamine-1-phosphate N-acetyltransferase